MSERDATLTPTAEELRAAWQPDKLRLQAVDPHHPTNIRVHRALSWLDAAEAQPEDADDERLLLRWVAFNALYGKWDERLLKPCGDRESFRAFLGEVATIDRDGTLAQLLDTHKPLVLTLLDNAFLRGSFWEHPSLDRARKRTKHRQDAQQLYARGQHAELLADAFEPAYFLRCQLVHGASTRGSGKNRESLRHVNALLGWAVPVILAVMIDHGMDADWGPLCYPPQ